MWAEASIMRFSRSSLVLDTLYTRVMFSEIVVRRSEIWCFRSLRNRSLPPSIMALKMLIEMCSYLAPKIRGWSVLLQLCPRFIWRGTSSSITGNSSPRKRSCRSDVKRSSSTNALISWFPAITRQMFLKMYFHEFVRIRELTTRVHSVYKWSRPCWTQPRRWITFLFGAAGFAGASDRILHVQCSQLVAGSGHCSHENAADQCREGFSTPASI